MWQHVLAGVVVAAILAVAVYRIVLAAKGKGGFGRLWQYRCRPSVTNRDQW